MDVLPIERRDEDPVEPGHHLVGELVGLVLQPLDLVDDGAAAVGVGLEQFLQQPGGLHGECGDRGEEVEELLVAGQEPHCKVLVTGGGKISPAAHLARGVVP